MAMLRDFVIRVWADHRTDHWNPVLLLLYLLSFVYRAGICLRNFFFRIGVFQIKSLRRPVISIGNITVGGTGKTPTVIFLASLFQTRGYKPAILSRGYGGRTNTDVNIVSDGKSILMDQELSGDEPFMIAKSLDGIPVLTGRTRFLSGKYAVDYLGADLLILDDAFQHRKLARSFDIVLLNAKAPFGNGFLIPRGSLRDPETALRRADTIILTGTMPDSEEAAACRRHIKRKFPDIPVLTASYQLKDLSRNWKEVYPISDLKRKRVLAFCGIANPDSFKYSLESAGAEIVSFISYPDHFRYAKGDVEMIAQRAKDERVEMIVTTEKDGVKLSGFSDFFRNVYLLRIELVIEPKYELERLILERIAG
jgi:tetraacyldisaccharide 4'-kinase